LAHFQWVKEPYMLVSFSVENFRSFGEEVTLNMLASNKISDHESHLVRIGSTNQFLVRSAVIYGANAAGKSNLVKAIQFAQEAICNPPERRLYMPFRFVETGTEKKPSSFEFRFLLEERIFIYGFDIVEGHYVGEWLSFLRGGDDHEEQIFERDASDTVKVFPDAERFFQSDSIFTTLRAITQLPLRGEQLLLNRVASLPEGAQGPTLRAVIKWFNSTLITFSAQSRQSDLFDRLHSDRNFRTFCATFLNHAGTGVGGLQFSLREREGAEWEKQYLAHFGKAGTGSRRFFPFMSGDTDILPKPDNADVVIERTLISEHHIAPRTYHLPFSQESDGTQSLLQILPILASAPEQPIVVVLDELDRSLHPLLCWEIIRFFSESCPGAPRQFIVTTHEAHLLNQKLLRRDEYWFAEKDRSQQTKLSSLDEYKIRNDLKIERGYLTGRFGAIPIIGGMQELEKLLECDEREAADAEKKPTT
jgi:AAA15 family ATPase/GTPase